ncbi:MAG: hypothetical protein R2848_00220 [Thermomicrobiales bacterium]
MVETECQFLRELALLNLLTPIGHNLLGQFTADHNLDRLEEMLKVAGVVCIPPFGFFLD